MWSFTHYGELVACFVSSPSWFHQLRTSFSASWLIFAEHCFKMWNSDNNRAFFIQKLKKILLVLWLFHFRYFWSFNFYDLKKNGNFCGNKKNHEPISLKCTAFFIKKEILWVPLCVEIKRNLKEWNFPRTLQ